MLLKIGGGVCYGAVLTSDLDVIHQKAVNKQECMKLKGSKYVQSRIRDDLFKECKAVLEEGKTVLFSGSGCQVHGLINYLNMSRVDCSNLITMDFVCHGVPSPGIWKGFVKELEAQMGKKVTSVNFRDKEKFGWTGCKETYYFENGDNYSSSYWSDMFYQHCIIRESCFNCPYTTPYRETDFTVGDYWGFEKVVDGYRDNKGLTLLIAHNDKAREIVGCLSEYLDVVETSLEDSLQPQLIRPTSKGIEYDLFWKRYIKNPQNTIQKYFFPNYTRRAYLFLLQQTKEIVKRILKSTKTT